MEHALLPTGRLGPPEVKTLPPESCSSKDWGPNGSLQIRRELRPDCCSSGIVMSTKAVLIVRPWWSDSR